ncbi:hypothetical protein [Spiroplasma endosymbiont of Danaus chrysippus]|uniref:hypothetical protein n=1 Tax=Spiroplasma endosymbiont of Danaus chrysippus TaxID=2691041 RepID=UPI00157A7116|nr:hypothetical protein [Spiroplasma endosymbiont of Danaus chrysippus]
MAIKDPLIFITIEEFKNWKGFNKLEFDDTTTPDNEIWFAISVASNNIDYLSGYSISKKWPETTLTEFTDEIQTATAHYVRFLLTKDSNYIVVNQVLVKVVWLIVKIILLTLILLFQKYLIV